MSGISLEVCREDEGWDEVLPHAGDLASQAMEAAACAAGEVPTAAEVSLLLTSDEGIRHLNHMWRQTDAPTNVLSFPAGAPELPGIPVLLGDIAVARGVCTREADAAEISLSHHFSRLVIHGMLHLLGFEHNTDAAHARMEQLEKTALLALSFPIVPLTAETDSHD